MSNNTIRHKLIEAYAFAVTILESRPLLFTVHTIDGAIYSRLPLAALVTKKIFSEDLTEFEVDVWGSISNKATVIQHKYLKDYDVQVKINGKTLEGTYFLTIDPEEGGFAQDPEQHKTNNIVLLDNGQICSVPNNMCLFLDKHFVHKQVDLSKYKRNSRYYKI